MLRNLTLFQQTIKAQSHNEVISKSSIILRTADMPLMLCITFTILLLFASFYAVGVIHLLLKILFKQFAAVYDFSVGKSVPV